MKVIAITSALMALVVVTASVKECATAQVDARASLTETGVDEWGYWFARVRVENTGTLPWRAVIVGDLAVRGDPSFPIEVGSTVPSGEVPASFDLVIEGSDEDTLPERFDGFDLHLAVVSHKPWYLQEPRLGSWSFDLRR